MKKLLSQKWLHVLIVLIAVIITYSPAVCADWQFDDLPKIISNEDLTSFSDVLSTFTTNPRIFVDLSFASNIQQSGYSQCSFHVTNILIHAISSVMIYLLVLFLAYLPRLKKNLKISDRWVRIGALIAALVFAIHPVQTQAVSYAVQRYTSMATLLYIAALYLYLRYRQRVSAGRLISPGALRWYVGALVCSLLAFYSKQISLTLPIAIMLLDMFGWGIDKSEEEWRVRIIRWLPFFALLIGVFGVDFARIVPRGTLTHDGASAYDRYLYHGIWELSPTSYFITQWSVIVHYMRLVVLPVGLRFEYAALERELMSLQSIGSAALILVSIMLAFWLIKKKRLAGLGILFFFIFLSIESSIIPITDVIAEHRMYLPMVGVSLVLADIIYFLRKVSRPVISVLAVSITVMYMALLGGMAFKRNILWADGYLMAEDNLEKEPDIARVRSRYGYRLFTLGSHEEAIEEWQKVFDKYPDYIPVSRRLGDWYLTKREYDKALVYFQHAYELSPDSLEELGSLYYLYLDKLDSPDIAYELLYNFIQRNPCMSKEFHFMLTSEFEDRLVLDDVSQLIFDVIECWPEDEDIVTWYKTIQGVLLEQHPD